MPKSSAKQIEIDENRIISELLKNSRQSDYEIAKKCGFSRQKVWRIIKKLEKEKRIWGYSAVVTSEIDGFTTFFALCKSKVQFLDNTEQIIKNLQSCNSEKLGIYLKALYYVNGNYDWIVAFCAKNTISAKKFVGYMQKEYGESMDDVILLENVFSMVKCNIINPDIESLVDFSI